MTARNLPRRRIYAAWASGPLAVALGAAAHLLSGAAVPGPWVLLAIAALLSMAASMLAGLNLRFWAVLLASGLVQQGLHLVFAGFAGGTGSTLPGHTHGALIWEPPSPVQTSGGHHAMELMLDTHVAAALLTVLVLTQSGTLISQVSRLRRARTSRVATDS
ncbi:hypothetical protein F8G81_00875 [Arthrobacter sp. CDRTa11]|uniref:hypothetical protein n=1 Tax=Arthrobacter sp. CDRTa11 TaxID=2651199 RepID=UPI002265A944|nr:hypothetical protein [Arthrobacter sp. CDRTa11]UZX01331.1 hypothetical protein F8G81_00875 [Arthrobacter sp. CDRTa11]